MKRPQSQILLDVLFDIKENLEIVSLDRVHMQVSTRGKEPESQKGKAIKGRRELRKDKELELLPFRFLNFARRHENFR